MHYLPNVLFALLLVGGFAFFIRNVKKIFRNIKLGKPLDRSDRKGERWKKVAFVAFGQNKMFRRPFPAILHFIVYTGFIIVNIELLAAFLNSILSFMLAGDSILFWIITFFSFFNS